MHYPEPSELSPPQVITRWRKRVWMFPLVSSSLSLMSVLDVCPWCLSLMSVLDVCPWWLSLMTVLDVFPWCLSLMSVLDVCPWCLSLMSVLDVCPWCLSLMTVLDVFPWCLSLMSVLDVCPWCLSLMSVLDVCPWCLSLMTVLDVCPWWLSLLGHPHCLCHALSTEVSLSPFGEDNFSLYYPMLVARPGGQNHCGQWVVNRGSFLTQFKGVGPRMGSPES